MTLRDEWWICSNHAKVLAAFQPSLQLVKTFLCVIYCSREWKAFDSTIQRRKFMHGFCWFECSRGQKKFHNWSRHKREEKKGNKFFCKGKNSLKGNNSKGLKISVQQLGSNMLGRCVSGQGSNDDVSNFPEVNVNSVFLNLFFFVGHWPLFNKAQNFRP